MQKQAPQLFFFSTKNIGQFARYYKRKILNFFQFGLFIDLYPHFWNPFVTLSQQTSINAKTKNANIFSI